MWEAGIFIIYLLVIVNAWHLLRINGANSFVPFCGNDLIVVMVYPLPLTLLVGKNLCAKGALT